MRYALLFELNKIRSSILELLTHRDIFIMATLAIVGIKMKVLKYLDYTLRDNMTIRI